MSRRHDHRLGTRAPAVSACLLLILLASSSSRFRAGELTRGPYLQSLVDDSVQIFWQTADVGFGRVTYWNDPEDRHTNAETLPSIDHVIELVDLEPATEYSYEVIAGDGSVLASGDGLRFRTAPTSGEGNVRALVFGDSGADGPSQLVLAERMVAVPVDLVLHTGDLVYEARDEDRVLFGMYERILSRSDLRPALGNHDSLGWFQTRFSTPGGFPSATAAYYSFDWGPAHFVVLDTEIDIAEGSAQLTWARTSLESARASGIPWTVLLMHRPVYSLSFRGIEAGLPEIVSQSVSRLADEHDVDLVLSAHDHHYTRTFPLRGGEIVDRSSGHDYLAPGGTVYVVTGGGGAGTADILRDSEDAPLMAAACEAHHALDLEITPTRLTVNVLRVQSSGYHDWFAIYKSPSLAPAPLFLRGDANASGEVGLSDAIYIFRYLFDGCLAPACLDATDATDDGAIDIADGIRLLQYIFVTGEPTPPPGPTVCGDDPTDDSLECSPVFDACS